MVKRITLTTQQSRAIPDNLDEQEIEALPEHAYKGRRFYLLLLLAGLILYPLLDPLLFGFGTTGRVARLGDAGFYVILALGLNIVVGFAGLLDLGYVAFFAIGAYCWGVIGSSQFTAITGLAINQALWSWLFWPMLVLAALFTAFCGALLGIPTLRLKGDYLAIVTLGFGEIVPIIFLQLDKFTNGVSGIVGIYSPAFPGIDWSLLTPVPYYYLVLVLIVLSIFANVHLRDSRFGRAWIAMREDEGAARMVGVNVARTKLFAFAAGAFFSGIAGAYHAAKLGLVTPDQFSFTDSIIYLAMIAIGGLGSIPGVIVGALSVFLFSEFVLGQLNNMAFDPANPLNAIQNGVQQLLPGFTFGGIRNLIFGVLLILIMIFRPAGLIPNARRKRELQAHDEEELKVTALDKAE